MTLNDLLIYAKTHALVKPPKLAAHFNLGKDGMKEVDALLKRAASDRLFKWTKTGYRLTKRGRMKALEIPMPAKNGRPMPKNGRNFSGEIGRAKDDAKYVIEKYAIPHVFPPQALDELEAIPESFDDAPLPEGREDIRALCVVTIDGEDAKDFDDAINIEKTADGYALGVHIADVSYFVKKGGALDKEAYTRGNSVYLMDTVVPMFPKKISNTACSLNEGVTRYAVSAFITLDASGRVTNYRFAETAIRSSKRLTYEYAQKVIDGEETADERITALLTVANELMHILRALRIKEGSIDFDFDETKFLLNEEGEVVSVRPYKRLDAHKMIEEFMLLANKCAAEYISEHTEAIYRVHDEPDEEKLMNFKRIAHNRGYRLQYDAKTRDVDYKAFFAAIKGTPDEKLLSTLLLRSMKQAYYDTENIGHYGLRFDYYAHFTSPIRRYSDLEAHRILKRIMKQRTEVSNERFEALTKIAEQCSKTERVAVEAERELEKIKGARFLKRHVGEAYDGIITGVTNFGVFIEISEFGLEGLARYNDMNDAFIVDESDHEARGRHTNARFALGDKTRVQIMRVTVEKMFVDLLILDAKKG